MEQARQRFESKINKGECWLWTSSIHEKGYGEFMYKKRKYQSHRFSYLLNVGEIPEGHVVRHKCRNRNCVNPEHLETGTVLQNNQDMIRDGTIHKPKGELNGRVKLTENQVREIRLRSNELQRKLAEEYNVGITTISAVITRKTWSHL
jgi:hypothetical protein